MSAYCPQCMTWFCDVPNLLGNHHFFSKEAGDERAERIEKQAASHPSFAHQTMLRKQYEEINSNP